MSVHGANRLGTNSLLDIVVFGRRAGLAMAEEARRVSHAGLPDEPERETARMLSGLLERPRTEPAAAIRDELQRGMDANAAVFRTEALLREQEEKLAGLQERCARLGVQDRSRSYNTDLMETIECANLVDLAEVLVTAALARTESRGGHYRDDHPARDDDNWLKHSLAWKSDGTVRLSYKPVTITTYTPIERKY